MKRFVFGRFAKRPYRVSVLLAVGGLCYTLAS